MFILDSGAGLCLMVGSARKKLERNDVQYYYDNMLEYGQIILNTIKPYQSIMQQISKEVKSFGGIGKIHGCIVDISWYSHIYVNPFDGKVTSYWALDTSSRKVYDDIKTLIKEKEQCLLKRLTLEYKNHSIPLIEKHLMKNNNCLELAIMPQWVFGRKMYEPSRIMKSVQYVWEHNVIRIWNDDVLNTKKLKAENDIKMIE